MNQSTKQIYVKIVRLMKILVFYSKFCIDLISSSIEVFHHTPNQTSLKNCSHNKSSPLTKEIFDLPITSFQSPFSPRNNPNTPNGQNRSYIVLTRN